MLIDQLVNLCVLVALSYAIYQLITHARLQPQFLNKSCRNCFWLYNAQNTVFCSDPDKPVRFLDRSLIKKFHCSRWAVRKDVL